MIDAHGHCDCPSCEMARRRSAPGYRCECCNGTGAVESISGGVRPCSRCQIDAFDAWAAARRPAIKVD